MSHLFALASLLILATAAQASDHLDSPTVTRDAAADIGDFYAWMSPDAKRLNLVMTLVGASFSDRIDYVFHIDSGPTVGAAAASFSLKCRFAAPGTIDCHAGDRDRATGDASHMPGVTGERKRFRVFADLRDDPFFNNVRGTRAALNVAAAALPGSRGMRVAVLSSARRSPRRSSRRGGKPTESPA